MKKKMKMKKKGKKELENVKGKMTATNEDEKYEEDHLTEYMASMKLHQLNLDSTLLDSQYNSS